MGLSMALEIAARTSGSLPTSKPAPRSCAMARVEFSASSDPTTTPAPIISHTAATGDRNGRPQAVTRQIPPGSGLRAGRGRGAPSPAGMLGA